MRFPKPPSGMVDCAGSIRSNALKVIVLFSIAASVIRLLPKSRAVFALTSSRKKNQTCAPSPDLDRSTATSIPWLFATCRMAFVASFQSAPSKSMTRTFVLLSLSSTYWPITSRSLSSLPLKWAMIAASLNSGKTRLLHSVHLTLWWLALGQMPDFHSFAQAGV